MTRRLAGALALAAALALPACTRLPPTLTLSLVGTNDLHGGVLDVNGRGGLALLDSYVGNLRAARAHDAGGVLLLDAGDLFQGTLESNLNEGAVVVEAYNAMGYAAAAVGNHEFDFGPVGPAAVPHAPDDDPRGALKARLAQAQFPWLAANIVDAATGAPVAWPNVTPSTIVVAGGVKVGLVGVVTEPTLQYAMAANVVGLQIAPLVDTLVAQAQALRTQGATVVVALAHAGGKCTQAGNPTDLSSCGASDEIFQVAEHLPPGTIDAIVAGHRHELIAHEAHGIPIIQSYWRGRAFGRIDLTVDRTTGRVTGHHVFPPQDLCARQRPGDTTCAAAADSDAPRARYEGAEVVPSARIAQVLAPAVEAATTLKARPLGATVAVPMAKIDFDQNPVADLEADWLRAAVPGADVAVINSAGVRSDLPAGPLTYGRLFDLVPFDNQRLTIELTAAELKRVVAANVAAVQSMVVLSGVTARVSCRGPAVEVTLRRTDGRPLADTARLAVVTSDFLSTGGDGIFSPVMPLRIVGSGDLMRDEMARTIERAGETWGQERVDAPHRVTLDGTRPFRCGAK